MYDVGTIEALLISTHNILVEKTYCGYSLEWPYWGLLIGTNKICFHREIRILSENPFLSGGMLMQFAEVLVSQYLGKILWG